MKSRLRFRTVWLFVTILLVSVPLARFAYFEHYRNVAVQSVLEAGGTVGKSSASIALLPTDVVTVTLSDDALFRYDIDKLRPLTKLQKIEIEYPADEDGNYLVVEYANQDGILYALNRFSLSAAPISIDGAGGFEPTYRLRGPDLSDEGLPDWVMPTDPS